MRRKLAEGSVIFVSILKWFVLATIIGAIVGFSTVVFLKLLDWGLDFTGRFPYFFLFLPAAFFLSALLVKYLAPDAKGHGTEKVIEAVHKSSGKIRAAVVPVKLVATLITIISGGSVGKEGPCAQIGAGLSSMFSDFFKFDGADRKKLVICGISAGFAAVFGTPIAGALFGVEVLFVGSILYDVLLPSFIAGVTSFHVSNALGIAYFHEPLRFVPQFSEFFFIQICFAGVFFGVCSLAMVELMKLGDRLAQKIKLWEPLKGMLGGVLLVGLTFLFSRRYLGLGLATIQATLHGQEAPWYAFIVKMIFTSLTLGFGGSGGVVTPVFFVGATAGSLFAGISGLDHATLAAIGFVGLLAGTTNTPIASSVMATELFGPEIAPYAAVACVISFLMTGHRSIYPSQVLLVKKSSSLTVDIGKEIESVEIQLNLRAKSWSKNIRDAYTSFKSRLFEKNDK